MEGGMIELVRDNSRGNGLAQLFAAYASLPECFGVIENAFLDATRVVCTEVRETWIASGTMRSAFLEQVRAPIESLCDAVQRFDVVARCAGSYHD